MDNFNFKQYLFENKVGMYSKAALNENELMDSEILGKEIAKQHPELIRYRHDGETKKYQDAIFKYAGELLHDAGIGLNMVRGLANDQDWAMELVSAVGDGLEHGEDADYSTKEDMPGFGGTWDALSNLSIKKEASSNSIKVLRDLYYFDKLSLLAAKEDVDPKYYKYGTLWANKGDVIDSNQEEYDMITDSDRLKKGVDYISGGLKEMNPANLGAAQDAADAHFDQEEDQSYGNIMESAYGNVGSMEKIAPVETGLNKYLDLVNRHDFFHHFSDDPRAWNQGQAEKEMLKSIYASIPPVEKQKAMDAFVDKYLHLHDPKQFPNAANNVKYITTDTFKGAI
jgi:hypothetical protein